jgi:hypothetical protein
MPEVSSAKPAGEVPASPVAAVAETPDVAAALASSQPAPVPPPALALGPAPMPATAFFPAPAPIAAAAGVQKLCAAAPAPAEAPAGAPEVPGSTEVVGGDTPGQPRVPSPTTTATEGAASQSPKAGPSARTAAAVPVASPVSAPLPPSPDAEAPEPGLAMPVEEASEAAPGDMILAASQIPPAVAEESRGDTPAAERDPDPVPPPGPATLPVLDAAPVPILAAPDLSVVPGGPSDPSGPTFVVAATDSRPAPAASAQPDAMAAEARPSGESSAGDPAEHLLPDAPAAVGRPAEQAPTLAPARPEAAATGAADGLKPLPLGELPRTPSVEAGSPVAAPASGGSPPPPAMPPARQVAPIAIALAFAPGGQAGFTLALEPAEMGRVEIRLRREGDGHALHITVERPETLGLLQRDRQELNSSLAQAGLRVDGADLTFSLEGRPRRRRGRAAAAASSPRRAASRPAGAITAPPPVLRHGLLDLNI